MQKVFSLLKVGLFIAAFMIPMSITIENADALGNYGCGNPDKQTHVNCLRGLLSSTPHGIAVKQRRPGNDGLGFYGCGNRDKRTHVNCLRGLLDQHGAHLQVGQRGQSGAGTPPPTYDDKLMHVPARPMGDISHCAEFSGPPKAACEAAANAPAPVMGDISHCAEFSGPPKAACEAAASAPAPMDDPCMVVPAGPDRDACYATTPGRP